MLKLADFLIAISIEKVGRNIYWISVKVDYYLLLKLNWII